MHISFTRIGPMLILALLLSLLMFPLTASADGVTPLTDFSFIPDEAAGIVTLTKYTGAGGAVTVAGAYEVGGVTCQTVLDTQTVFADNTKITSVTLQAGVAFRNDSMARLFSGCKKLASVDLSHVNTIGVTDMSFLFYWCEKLTALDVSAFDTSAVTTMENMFGHCEGLRTFTGYENWQTGHVTNLFRTFDYVSNDHAGASTRLKTIDISRWDLSRVINSGWCFEHCHVDSVLLPDSLAVISAGFFNHATDLTAATFTIPAGVKKIGYAHTFYDMGTDSFTAFDVAPGNTAYKAVDGILYSADGTEMLGVPRGKTFPDGVYAIPEGVTFLPELSISRNRNITTIVLPDSYTIRPFVPAGDPQYTLVNDRGNLNWTNSLAIALYIQCNVNSYAVKDTHPLYASREGVIYSRDMTRLISIPSLYNRMLDIPEGVTDWESFALWEHLSIGYLKNFKGVRIPKSLTYIGRDQVLQINAMVKKYPSFTLTVHEDNPVYRINEDGLLAPYTITPRAVYLAQDTFLYDGTPKEPAVTVSYDDLIYVQDRADSYASAGADGTKLVEYLREGVDYTLAYENNVAPGQAWAVVTGMGQYSGVTKVPFSIRPIPVPEAPIIPAPEAPVPEDPLPEMPPLPPTGDDAQPALWAAMLLFTGAALLLWKKRTA